MRNSLMSSRLMSARSRTTGSNTVTGLGISVTSSLGRRGLAKVYISTNWR